jgi:hypothetical protein
MLGLVDKTLSWTVKHSLAISQLLKTRALCEPSHKSKDWSVLVSHGAQCFVGQLPTTQDVQMADNIIWVLAYVLVNTRVP